MKKAFKKWNSISLVLRILGGLLLGVIFGLIEANFAGKEVLGFVFPSLSAISILGTVFVGALKGIAPVLVFFLVMSAISKGGKSHSGVIRTVIILYMASTLLAAVVAVFASMIFKVQMILPEAVTDTTAPQDIMEVFQTLLLNVVSNPISAIAEGNYIGLVL